MSNKLSSYCTTIKNIFKRRLWRLCCIILVSCVNNTIEQDLQSFKSKPIILPKNAQLTLNGENIHDKNYNDIKYKMVIYTDPTSCSKCKLEILGDWYKLIESTKIYDSEFKYYFIFSPPKGENIRLALRNSMLDYPMLLDSLGEFERLNPHLPKNKAMHTFLLDENNNVVLVGNPLHNPKIEKMFKEIIEEKLGEKE